MGIVTGAIFSESELRAVAQALGDTEAGLTNAEIDELLQLSGIPDEFGPGTKWKRIFVNLWNKQANDGHRKSSLAFIRKAMKPERYLRNPQRFSTMLASLNMALSFAGLEMNDAGDLRRVTRVHTITEAERRAKELRADLQARCVHPDVLDFCRAELVADNYFHAVLEAAKSIFDKLRRLTGLSEDGAQLVDKALGGCAPLLAINGLGTQSEQSEQSGFANLIKGIYGMFRNPTAHEPRVKWQMSKDDAEDLLSLASLIHRRLDSARRRT
jgi:uncharacterized protein (TIGR02391 family)